MKRVRIVTDSTADIPAVLASELDISVVPCQVHFDGEMYQDGVTLAPQAFFHKLARSSELPRTSQPPISEFVDTYRQIMNGESGNRIVSIHVASSLSGTVNAAWAAAQMLPEPSCVQVIDSGQLSMGLGWATIGAARIAQTGATQAEVGQAVRSLLPRLRTAAALDTLENLYKGGRISQVSAALGTALRIKPLLGVQDGRVPVLGRVRTRSRAMTQLEGLVRSWGALAEMAVMHAAAEELAQELARSLKDLVPASRMMVALAGPALTTHLGLGTVGVCALTAADS